MPQKFSFITHLLILFNVKRVRFYIELFLISFGEFLTTALNRLFYF